MKTQSLLLAGLCLLMPSATQAARKGDFAAKPPSTQVAAGLTTVDLATAGTPADLVTALLGPGITASNVTFTGSNLAAGTFAGGTGIIGFESGIVLGSGCISNIVGPNATDGITCDNALPGDADLDALSGFPTFDAVVLEFDFVPTDPAGTMLLFSYVFSSDEYNEWVVSPYNDVFAFYVNGQNCALVPGIGATPDPVEVHSVNDDYPLGGPNARNPLLYRNNDLDDGGGSINTEMDGLTVVLGCQAAIIPNATNHIKLAISDASDPILDSNVLIRASSFTSTGLGISLVPPSAFNPVGTAHTVTATVLDSFGVPEAGREIAFTVTSGPNEGANGTCTVNADCTTDSGGQVSFTYVGGPEPGIDSIRACFDDAGGNENCSPSVTKQWLLPCVGEGTPCWIAPDDCEIQDTCVNGFCQDNGFLPATTICRGVKNLCDAAEYCTGNRAACPLDMSAPDGTVCIPGVNCQPSQTCIAGACTGTLPSEPGEVDGGLQLAIVEGGGGSAVISWNLAPRATASSVLLGLVGLLPVGPGGGDEQCLGQWPSSILTHTDAGSPAPGTAFWYLVRGENSCGSGSYGWAAANGAPTVERMSSTCGLPPPAPPSGSAGR